MKRDWKPKGLKSLSALVIRNPGSVVHEVSIVEMRRVLHRPESSKFHVHSTFYIISSQLKTKDMFSLA